MRRREANVASCPDEPRKDPSAVLCSSSKWLAVAQLAHAAAPVLILSPDEPIAPPAKIPERLPCHASSLAGRVAYYRLMQYVRPIPTDDDPSTDPGDASPVVRNPPEGAEIDLSRVRLLRLRYFFYYSVDEGVNEHLDDLESADMLFHVEGGAAYVVRLFKVIGAAHGSAFQANHLRLWDVTPELELGRPAKPRLRDRTKPDRPPRWPSVTAPVAMMVEEGKHASCPDRNGDGIYTPGFDVNEAVDDAWGVRDVFGAGLLGDPKYQSSMTKPRGDGLRLRPSPLPCSTETAGPADEDYLLCPAVPACGAAMHSWMHKKMNELIGRTTAGELPAPKQAYDDLELEGLGVARFLSVNARREGGWGGGVGVTMGRAPLVSGWLLLGLNSIRSEARWNTSLELVYTPSISQWFGWYAAGGVHFRASPGWIAEGGIQVRFRVVAVQAGIRHRNTFDSAAADRHTGATFSLHVRPTP